MMAIRLCVLALDLMFCTFRMLNKCYEKAGELRGMGVSKDDVVRELQQCIAQMAGGVVGTLSGELVGGENVVSDVVKVGVKKVLEVSGVGQVGFGGGERLGVGSDKLEEGENVMSFGEGSGGVVSMVSVSAAGGGVAAAGGGAGSGGVTGVAAATMTGIDLI